MMLVSAASFVVFVKILAVARSNATINAS